MFSRRTLYAQHPLSLRTSLPGSRLRFFIAINSVILRAHLCTAVDSICEKHCVRNRSRGEREGLSFTHVQREYLAEPSMRRILCHQGVSHFSPVLACVFSSRWNFTTLTSTPLYSSRLCAENPVFENVHQESVKVCTTKMLRTIYTTV